MAMLRFNNGKKGKDSESNPQESSRKQEAYYCYRYPHPAVTVDCVILEKPEQTGTVRRSRLGHF